MVWWSMGWKAAFLPSFYNFSCIPTWNTLQKTLFRFWTRSRGKLLVLWSPVWCRGKPQSMPRDIPKIASPNRLLFTPPLSVIRLSFASTTTFRLCPPPKHYRNDTSLNARYINGSVQGGIHGWNLMCFTQIDKSLCWTNRQTLFANWESVVNGTKWVGWYDTNLRWSLKSNRPDTNSVT